MVQSKNLAKKIQSIWRECQKASNRTIQASPPSSNIWLNNFHYITLRFISCAPDWKDNLGVETPLLPQSRDPNAIPLVYTARAVFALWVGQHARFNFFVTGSSPFFSCNVEGVIYRELITCFTDFWHLDQSQRHSAQSLKSANFGRFLPSQISEMRASIKFVPKNLCLRISPQLIGGGVPSG